MAKFCTECGSEIREGVAFCTECGTKAPADPVPATTEPVAEVEEPKTPPPAADAPPAQNNAQPQPQNPPQQPQQTYAQPQQTYAQPQQAYAQPQQAYAHPQQAYAQPQQTYAQPQPVYQQPAPVYAQPGQEQAPGPGSRYGLISTWGYIGIMLLLCIPIIGFFLTVIWACGGCRKYQKRNLCRAMLIFMAFSLITTLILGFAVKGLIDKAIDSVKAEISETVDTEEGNLFSGIFGGLFGGGDTEAGGNPDDLTGLLSGLMGGDLSGLLGEVDKINEEAAKHSSGWPSDLPKYPDGTMESMEDYRTLITGSSAESMWSYVDKLKNKGFQFQDFYEMGMSEADMKSMNAWWGTNGKWYLSMSYVDGTVTVDHTTELPDLSGLFG